MGSVVVHRFTKYNIASNKEEMSTRMGTREAITGIKGLVMVEGSEATIDHSLLDSDGFTAENFKP